MSGQTRNADRVIAYLAEHGPQHSENGWGLWARLAEELGIKHSSMCSAAARLERRGIVWVDRPQAARGYTRYVFGVGLTGIHPPPPPRIGNTAAVAPPRPKARTPERLIEHLRAVGVVEGGRTTMPRLAAALTVTPGALWHAVRKLENAGLIEVTRDGRLVCRIQLAGGGDELSFREGQVAAVVALFRSGFLRHARAEDVLAAVGLTAHDIRRLQATSTARTAS